MTAFGDQSAGAMQVDARADRRIPQHVNQLRRSCYRPNINNTNGFELSPMRRLMSRLERIAGAGAHKPIATHQDRDSRTGNSITGERAYAWARRRITSVKRSRLDSVHP